MERSEEGRGRARGAFGHPPPASRVHGQPQCGARSQDASGIPTRGGGQDATFWQEPELPCNAAPPLRLQSHSQLGGCLTLQPRMASEAKGRGLLQLLASTPPFERSPTACSEQDRERPGGPRLPPARVPATRRLVRARGPGSPPACGAAFACWPRAPPICISDERRRRREGAIGLRSPASAPLPAAPIFRPASGRPLWRDAGQIKEGGGGEGEEPRTPFRADCS